MFLPACGTTDIFATTVLPGHGAASGLGYVDAAPLVACMPGRAADGRSLWALRILPALAGAGLIALTILIVRELGGGRYAQCWRDCAC